jgi:hypothetical protein
VEDLERLYRCGRSLEVRRMESEAWQSKCDRLSKDHCLHRHKNGENEGRFELHDARLYG